MQPLNRDWRSDSTRIAVFVLNPGGYETALAINRHLKVDIYIKEGCRVSSLENVLYFKRLSEDLKGLFNKYDGLIFVMSIGIINRVIAPLIHNKYTDPAVVAVDEGMRYTVSMLSGHEGGANGLTSLVSGIIGAQPVITTMSDTLKVYTCGVGCRKGVEAGIISDAISAACSQAGIGVEGLRFLATAWLKYDEQGIKEAARDLSLYVRYIPKPHIDYYYERLCSPTERSNFVYESVGVYGVAESCAVMSGHLSRIVLPRTVYNGVTVAIAKDMEEYF